jgi:hypothetical protein
MYRWSSCPGSVALINKLDLPKYASEYAEDGSDAHALAALCLTKGQSAGPYAGKTVKHDGRKFLVTDEMADAVQVYIDAVDEAAAREDASLLVEQRFDLSSVHPGCFGTADAVVWLAYDKTLIVFDYKHGAGVPVKVQDNPQLQYYGLGALLSSGYPAKRVKLVIVQPRCDHADGPVREWEIDAIDLLDFRADLKSYAEATEKADAPLVPGDHCRFCAAAALCPALAKRAQAVAKIEFSPVLSYDPGQLRLALDSREPLKAWLKALDEFAYNEAMQGRKLPGYKLVEKRANRKWGDEGAVIERLQDVFGDVIYQPRKVRSPAQMEKELTKTSFAQVADLVVKESSGLALVPDIDKRSAAKPSAREEFMALENGTL